MEDLSQDYLNENLYYNPATGEFRRKKNGIIGKIAGCSGQDGYWLIKIKGRTRRAHRVAWIIMTGQQPPKIIDHIDRDTGNNRWNNLREVDDSESSCNRQIRPNNRSGVPGVSIDGDRFKVAVTFRKVYYYLGTFDTLEEAKSARLEGEKRIMGEFAAKHP